MKHKSLPFGSESEAPEAPQLSLTKPYRPLPLAPLLELEFCLAASTTTGVVPLNFVEEERENLFISLQLPNVPQANLQQFRLNSVYI